MTRGIIGMLVGVLALLPGPALALDWERLWRNEDQIAAGRMRAGDHEAAARTFEDRRWQAAAWYRAGDYERAAEALKGMDDTVSLYNRGNALAKSGDLDGAIAAYETVLEREPGHADARHNLEVIQHLVKGGSSETGESEEEQEQQESGESERGGGGDRSADSRDGSGADSGTDQGESRSDASGAGDSGGSRREARSGEQGEADAGSRGEPGSPQSLPEPASGTPEDGRDPERTERRASMEQWLRRVPDDPGGLLRRKFRYQYSRRGHDDPPGGEAW